MLSQFLPRTGRDSCRWRVRFVDREAPLRAAAPVSSVNTSRRVTSNPVDEVCVCEQQGAPRVDRLCSRNPRHERKPSPDRHPSASAAEEEAEQAARADCGGSSRRTCRARSEGAAHIFTLPQAGSEAGTAARGPVATVNAAWTRRPTVSEFHRASGATHRPAAPRPYWPFGQKSLDGSDVSVAARRRGALLPTNLLCLPNREQVASLQVRRHPASALFKA
jgi:hypothetical protein